MYVAYIKDYVYHLLIELKCKFLLIIDQKVYHSIAPCAKKYNNKSRKCYLINNTPTT